MNTKTAIIYARVSTTRQAEEELPVEGQIERCRAKAAELGAAVVEVFRDDGLSGQRADRPDFQESLNYCASFSPDYYITWSSSRLARNKVEASLAKKLLAEVETQLVYVSTPLDLSSDSGWLLDGMFELMDEWQSKTTARDTLRSMVKIAEEGYWCGGRPPMGLEVVPAEDNPKRKRVRMVPHEAEIVREIFRLRTEEGIGAKSIAVLMNEAGKLNRGKPWHKSSILSLLRNERLAGYTVFGKRVRVAGARRQADREQWIRVESHPPVVPRELWKAAQEAMDDQIPGAEEQGSPKSSFLFTGLLHCGVCGASMQIETAKGRSKRYEYYNCRRAQKHGDCANRRVPARELDDFLLDHIANEVFTADNLRDVVMELNEVCGNWALDHRRRRTAIVRRLQDVEGRNRKLYDVLELMGKEAPNLGDLTIQLRKNNAEIRQLEGELAKVDAEQPPEPVASESDVEELADLLVEVIRTTKNPKKARAFFGSFVDGIYLESESVRVEYQPHALLNQPVHSKPVWLPGTGSNRRPSD